MIGYGNLASGISNTVQGFTSGITGYIQGRDVKEAWEEASELSALAGQNIATRIRKVMPEYLKAATVAAGDITKGKDAALSQLSKGEEYLQPYWEAGYEAIPKGEELLNLLGDPEKLKESFFTSPGYEFRLEEGAKLIQNQMNKRGLSLSGQEIKELAKYGQGLASDEWGKYLNNINTQLAGWGGIAGQGGAAAGGLANIAGAKANLESSAANNIARIGLAAREKTLELDLQEVTQLMDKVMGGAAMNIAGTTQRGNIMSQSVNDMMAYFGAANVDMANAFSGSSTDWSARGASSGGGGDSGGGGIDTGGMFGMIGGGNSGGGNISNMNWGGSSMRQGSYGSTAGSGF